MKFEVFWKNPGYQVRPELKEDIECDYLIVGGGIAGVSASYHLAKLGAQNIVLIEKHEIGSGATGKASGTFVTRGERDLNDLVVDLGEEKARWLWTATHKALSDIKNIIDEGHIECEDEVQDTLVCGFKGKNFYDVRVEFEAERKIETTTRFFEKDQIRSEINSPMFDHGMLSSRHALCLNPLKFIQGLSHVVEKYGVRIYENTALIRTSNGVAETHHGNIKYKNIIWATDIDYPSSEIKNLKTTVIVTRPLSTEELSEIRFAHRKKVVWDTRKNEYYFKITHDNRMLVGFGGIIVHKKHRKTDPHFPHLHQLENYLEKLFPQIQPEIEYAWSGHFSVNGHWSKGPLVKVQGNEGVITGCGSQVVCFMAAEHVARQLTGNESPLGSFFN